MAVIVSFSDTISTTFGMMIVFKALKRWDIIVPWPKFS